MGTQMSRGTPESSLGKEIPCGQISRRDFLKYSALTGFGGLIWAVSNPVKSDPKLLTSLEFNINDWILNWRWNRSWEKLMDRVGNFSGSWALESMLKDLKDSIEGLTGEGSGIKVLRLGRREVKQSIISEVNETLLEKCEKAEGDYWKEEEVSRDVWGAIFRSLFYKYLNYVVTPGRFNLIKDKKDYKETLAYWGVRRHETLFDPRGFYEWFLVKTRQEDEQKVTVRDFLSYLDAEVKEAVSQDPPKGEEMYWTILVTDMKKVVDRRSLLVVFIDQKGIETRWEPAFGQGDKLYETGFAPITVKLPARKVYDAYLQIGNGGAAKRILAYKNDRSDFLWSSKEWYLMSCSLTD